jgi:hypothetical protein
MNEGDKAQNLIEKRRFSSFREVCRGERVTHYSDRVKVKMNAARP